MPNVTLLSPNDLRQHTSNVFRRPIATYGKLSDAHLSLVVPVPSFATLLWETFCAGSAVNLSGLTVIPFVMNTVQNLKKKIDVMTQTPS